MLHNHFLLYICGYETQWHPTAIRGSSSLSHATDPQGQIQSGNCRYFRNIKNVREPMVPGVPKERKIRTCLSKGLRSNTQAFCQRERQVVETASEGSLGVGLFNRFVDFGENFRYDEKEDGRRVQSPSYLENTGEHELDVPKAGAKSLAAERKRDRKLEAVPMAAYKKTLNDLAPTWCLKMKVALCLHPMSNILGRPKEKPRMFFIGLSRIKSLLSVLFRFPRSGKEYDSFSASNPATSPVNISFNFFNTSFGICRAMSFLFGMAARSIAAKKLLSFFIGIQGSIRFGFHPMLRNSIRLNSSGLKSIPIWQMDDQLIWDNYHISYTNQPGKNAPHRKCCAPVCIGVVSFVR